MLIRPSCSERRTDTYAVRTGLLLHAISFTFVLSRLFARNYRHNFLATLLKSKNCLLFFFFIAVLNLLINTCDVIITNSNIISYDINI